jgi:hypothetical protein
MKCNECGKNHNIVKVLVDGYICPVNKIPVYIQYREVRL